MAQKEVVTTEVDELIKLVQSKKEISIADAAKALSTTESAVEQFADLLQEEGILELKYKFTTPYLSYKGSERAENLMAEQKKAESFYIEPKKQDEEEDSAVSKAENEEDIPEALRKKGFGKAAADSLSANAPITPITNAIEIPEPKIVSEIVSEDDRQKIAETASELAKPKPINEKISDFNSAILQVYEDMKAGNFETAKHLYGLITHYYGSLPEKYSSEKDRIVDQLIELSKKLAVNIDMFNEKEFNDKVKKITELGKLCYNLIDKKNFGDAGQRFNELKELYAQLPFGFLEKKTELHDKLVKLHETLVNSRTKAYAGDLSRKSMIIGKLLENGWNALGREDVDKAAKAYQEIKKIQQTLPAGFMQKKILIGENITEFYQEFAAIKSEVSVEEFNSKKAQIKSLIAQAQSLIGAIGAASSNANNNSNNNSGSSNRGNYVNNIYHGNDNGNAANIENAIALFKQAKQILASMPRGFMEEKSALQSELFNIDKQLLQVKLRVTKAELGDKRNKILALISIAEKYINKGEPDLAATVYDEILNIYNILPAGYLEEKTKLKTKMLEMYKRSVLAADNLYLKNVDAKVQEHYNQLLQLIINAHKHVETRDFKALSNDYEYIRKMYEELPLGFIKNKLKIIDEIAKIGTELEILGKTEELKSTYVDDHKNAKKLIEEIYRIYDYLLENAPEDRHLLEHVKEVCSPYAVRLLEKGVLKIKRSKSTAGSSVASSTASDVHEITEHAKSAVDAKKALEQQRRASNLELEQREKEQAARANVAEKEKQEFMSQMLEQKQDALMHELNIEKERDILLKERDKVWQSKQELNAVMMLNEEVLREKEQLKKLQEKELLRKAKEEFIRKQIDQIKKEQQKKEETLKQEEDEKKKELEQLEELKLQEKEKFSLLKELERIKLQEQKTLHAKNKEHGKITREREQIKRQISKLKKNAGKANQKKIRLLSQSDAKLRKKLSALLRSRSDRSDIGISPEFIPKEKRLLGKKVQEVAEPVELGSSTEFASQGIPAPIQGIHMLTSSENQTQSYSALPTTALPTTEVDEEILKLEKEMKEENSKTLGLEEAQLNFDAQLELMAPEEQAPVVKTYEIHEAETEAQEFEQKKEVKKAELPSKKSEKKAEKLSKKEEKREDKKQKSAAMLQKEQKASQPTTWIEKKQLEIQRKLDLLDQGLLSEPRKGKSA